MSWGETYAFLVTATGWSWEYIADHMTIPRLFSLTDYWMKFPPIHLSLSGMVQAFGRSRRDRRPGKDADSNYRDSGSNLPYDKFGNPTKEAPKNAVQAVTMLGSGARLIKVRPKPLPGWTQGEPVNGR